MLHNHEHQHSISRNLVIALTLTLSFAFIELLVGRWAGSLALVADAGHMFSDSLSLLTLMGAAIAARLLLNNARYTFGLGKIDIFAAMINIFLVYAVAYHIFTAAIDRFDSPSSVNGTGILITACLGLVINLVVLKLLGELNSLGADTAKLHLVSDILGSIAAIISGISIMLTGLIYIDLALSIAICIFLIVASFRQLIKCTRIMLDATPDGISVENVEAKICTVDSVVSVHDIHIWRSGADEISLTAHVDVHSLEDWDDTLHTLNQILLENFGINHTTLQPETHFHQGVTDGIYHPE
tara:strand:- start:23261 stop:24154 length:894 start_codon:yes stop_codon:yes gene_type:complete